MIPWKEHTGGSHPLLAGAGVGGGTLVEDLDFLFFGLSLFLKHNSSSPVSFSSLFLRPLAVMIMVELKLQTDKQPQPHFFYFFL